MSIAHSRNNSDRQVGQSRQRHRRILAQMTIGMAVIGIAISSCSSSAQDAAADAHAYQLAQHLTSQNVTMYGAYWCPHCESQKELFGDAVEVLNYVECDPQGENAQPQLCQDKSIQGYPTWEIDGVLYPGTHSLKELAELGRKRR